MPFTVQETPGRPGAPLVLTFHGTGADEHQFHGLAERLFPGAHVVSPRGDVSENGMNRYFRRTGEGVYDMDDLEQRTRAMADYVAATRARVQADLVLGFGYSNGANILASVAFGHPGLFDGLGLLHPLIPWTPDPQPGLADVPVLISAGRQDPICPAPLTQALIDWFQAQGAMLTTAWHPGGHELVPSEIESLAQVLSPRP